MNEYEEICQGCIYFRDGDRTCRPGTTESGMNTFLFRIQETGFCHLSAPQEQEMLIIKKRLPTRMLNEQMEGISWGWYSLRRGEWLKEEKE